ncbi:MAG: hypothetical protein GF375_05135 [Candidatus Omnitrophica bacterium]|nr:hypothetical protein [Candidatus Omnitrophota bacterium]MBD3269376.1 hypothetical protein [Candidatus Omnitrophota bacterium]
MNIYINGKYSQLEDSKELLEPGFLFGWGIFESMRLRNSEIPFFSMHTERLKNSCKFLGIETPEENWQDIINRLVSENNLNEGYLRITVYKKREGTGVTVYVNKFSYYNASDYQKGFKAISSPQRRSSGAVSSKVKSISYLDNRLAWFEAQRRGKQEAIIFNHKGILCGGARSNIFLIKEGKVFTPSLQDGAFPGITRQVIINIAGVLSIPLREEELSEGDIIGCEEAFITSSLMEVMPLTEYNERIVGSGKPGKITLKFLEEYRSTFYGKS